VVVAVTQVVRDRLVGALAGGCLGWWVPWLVGALAGGCLGWWVPWLVGAWVGLLVGLWDC
jgi:hypothetical protein